MNERPLDPPEHKPFSGCVTFACFVNDETVEVRGRVDDDKLDFDTIEVWYGSAEVSALLHESQLDRIQDQFDANYHNIIEFDAEYA